MHAAPIVEGIVASGYRRSPAVFALLSLLALGSCLSLFDCLPAAAKAPGKGEMILFRATGSMWGATENRFSEHAFSLKSNRGVALWRDIEPDKVTIINPENRTYLSESISEYLGDNHYGIDVPINAASCEVKSHLPLDGLPTMETVFRVKPSGVRSRRRHRGVLAGSESMLKSFNKTSSGFGQAALVKSNNGSSVERKTTSGQPPVKSTTAMTKIAHAPAAAAAGAGAGASAAANPDATTANLIEVARVVSIKDISLAPAMLKAWTTIMLTNTKSGFPVSVVVRPGFDWREPDRKIEPSRSLITYKSIKFVPLQSKFFEIPPGFKKAQDKSAFYLSESGELKASDIDDLFRGELK